MARRISTKEIIATAVSYDMAEIEEYRYQSTRTSIPVYAIGDEYLCAPTSSQKLPKGWNWRVRGVVLGRTVYTAGTEIAS